MDSTLGERENPSKFGIGIRYLILYWYLVIRQATGPLACQIPLLAFCLFEQANKPFANLQTCLVALKLFACGLRARKGAALGTLAPNNPPLGPQSFALYRLQVALCTNFSKFLGHWRRIEKSYIFCIAPKGQQS